jgi:hypothetical protein
MLQLDLANTVHVLTLKNLTRLQQPACIAADVDWNEHLLSSSFCSIGAARAGDDSVVNSWMEPGWCRLTQKQQQF